MSNVNNRQHERIKHRANIQVQAAVDKIFTLEMRDFSETGLYLFCEDTSIVQMGDEVKVQTLEIEDAPILDAVVVRIEDNTGFAVGFGL